MWIAKIYLYDFKWKNKIIEFNGDLYHANPNKYIESDTPLSKIKSIKNKNITAKEIWDFDSVKIIKQLVKGMNCL